MEACENVVHFSAVNLMNCLVVAINHASSQMDKDATEPVALDLIPLDVRCNNPQPVGDTDIKNFTLHEIAKYFSKEQFKNFLKLFHKDFNWTYLDSGLLRVTLIPKYRREQLDELKLSIRKAKSETFIEYENILVNMIKAFFYIAVEISKKLPKEIKGKYKIIILEKDDVIKSLETFKVQNEALRNFFGFKFNDKLFPNTLFFMSSSFIKTMKLMPEQYKCVKKYINEVMFSEKDEIELLID